MNIENYSEKSIVVLGNTYDHREQLRNLGGVWNDHLKGGKSGWIFSAKKLEAVQQFVQCVNTNNVGVADVVVAEAPEEQIPALEPMFGVDTNNFDSADCIPQTIKKNSKLLSSKELQDRMKFVKAYCKYTFNKHDMVGWKMKFSTRRNRMNYEKKQFTCSIQMLNNSNYSIDRIKSKLIKYIV